MLTRKLLILPSVTITFCSLIHAPSTFLRSLVGPGDTLLDRVLKALRGSRRDFNDLSDRHDQTSCARDPTTYRSIAFTEFTDRAPTDQPSLRLRKVEQIEKRMARLIAGASIMSTAGDTPLKEFILPRESRNTVQGRPSVIRSQPEKSPSKPPVPRARRKRYAAVKLHLIALHMSDRDCLNAHASHVQGKRHGGRRCDAQVQCAHRLCRTNSRRPCCAPNRVQ